MTTGVEEHQTVSGQTALLSRLCFLRQDEKARPAKPQSFLQHAEFEELRDACGSCFARFVSPGSRRPGIRHQDGRPLENVSNGFGGGAGASWRKRGYSPRRV